LELWLGLGNALYTVHELANTITQQTIPTKPGNDFPALIANISTLPVDVPPGSTHTAAELLISPLSPNAKVHVDTGTGEECTRYLYASNRNNSPNVTQFDPLGDTIAIFATSPQLHVVNQVHTGLQQIRGMQLSNDGKYIAAAGLTGGGIAVFEVTKGGANLELRARYNGAGTVQLSSFVWL
jgi:6-phosphogluconolactonase (cycloisomerase 2 family)